MQIKQISVTGLFGIFDHVIPLNMDERITIVHGPNGFGKTAILRLLNGFFNSQYSVFRTIPFNEFHIVFDNNSYIKILSRGNIVIKLYQSNTKEDVLIIEKFKSLLPMNLLVEALNEIPELVQIDPKNWRDVSSGEIISLNEVLIRFEDVLYSKTQLRHEPDSIAILKCRINVRLIESQRLLNSIPKRFKFFLGADAQVSSMLPTVSAYSTEIAQIMRDKFTEYGAVSQSLDRTFPNRLVQRQSQPNLTEEQLRSRLEQLELTRSRLIEIGLLDSNENSDFSTQPPAMDDSTKNILSVYVEDVEKKLSVFYDLASKIELLRNIVNNKFAYSYKEMNFNKDKGFVFRTLYNSSVSDSDTLSPTDLSSGEQHELVLLYELLFKVKPKSLVLIDEPELSLHVGWQVQFLKDLQDIVKLADLDILMATHSPDIIQDRWDLTVELQGLKK